MLLILFISVLPTHVFVVVVGSRRSTARDVIYQLSAVGKWLSKLGVGEYENLFLINGYDDLDFMVRQCSFALWWRRVRVCGDKLGDEGGGRRVGVRGTHSKDVPRIEGK